MVINVLEDLLKSRQASTTSYRQLSRELQRHVPKVDAQHIAWHVTIPQWLYSHTRIDRRVKDYFPQYDTLHCSHCQDVMQIPLVFPRYHVKTLKAYREVFYAASSPQECACGNLKTLTDHAGNFTIYLQDNKDTSFSINHGPITLESSVEYLKDTDIDTLLHTKRPTVKDPFHIEARRNLKVNHINLMGCQEHTINMLLPTENRREYARAYHIILYLKHSVIFPTGHEVPYKDLKWPHKQRFKSAIVSYRRAIELNSLTEELFTTYFPQYLNDSHEKYVNNLAKYLDIPRSYAPNVPHTPFLQRLGEAWTNTVPFGSDKKLVPFNISYSEEPTPLAFYQELAILRLPHLSKKQILTRFHRQDYRYMFYTKGNAPTPLRISIKEPQLRYLKNERVRILQWMLPRFNSQSAIVTQRYTSQTLTHTTPHPHTPISILTNQ